MRNLVLVLCTAVAFAQFPAGSARDEQNSPPEQFVHTTQSDCTSCHKDKTSVLPTAAEMKSADCEECHDSAFLRTGIVDWEHPVRDIAQAGVSCRDCHEVGGKGELTLSAEGDGLCISCHEKERNEFRMLSKHPYQEGLVTCLGCHPPHVKRTVEITYSQVQRYGFSAINRRDPASLENSCLVCHRYYAITDLNSSGFIIANTLNLHELHLEKAFASCTECHGPHGAFSPKLIRSSLPDGAPLSYVGGEGWGTCSTNCHSEPHIQDKYGSGPRALSFP